MYQRPSKVDSFLARNSVTQGIGPTTAKKLKEAGIVSVMDLAVTSADELALDINASKEAVLPHLLWLPRNFLEILV
jgi:predicted flap endonuclease-1-like 5' DNA nuclease